MKYRIILLSCLLSSVASAQIAVTSGTILSIQATGVIYCPGDFTNNGTVLNNGTMIISGAWTNTGDYQAESGQVTFNGTGTQVINHNSQSFATLMISGGGEKVFKADITIVNQLSLQNGLLTTENHSKIILNQSATITGGSETSFVQGPLYQTGTGTKFFPVGTNSNYLPLTYSEVTGNNPVIGIEVIEPNPNNRVESGLTSVSVKRYWLVSTLSGTFTGSPVNISLLGEDPSQPLVVAEALGPNDAFHSLGGTIQQGSITSTDPAKLPWIAVGVENGKNILVYNVVTPGNNDGKHDFLKIVNIEHYPNNEVTIMNRWGDQVFQITGYNNVDRVFSGDGNTGGLKALSDGTYFYVINKNNGEGKINGFFILRR